MRNFKRLIIVTCAVMACTLLVIGCSDDDPVAPSVGTISITPEPAGLDAGWTLSGPGGFEQQGTGAAMVGNAAPGQYTLHWSEVEGWVTPADASGDLAGGGSLDLGGTYIEQGTIMIVVEPDHLTPGWTLSGPIPYEQIGVGATNLSRLVPGEYTIVWDDLPQRVTPGSETATLGEGQTIQFLGVYTVSPALSADEAMARFAVAYGGRDLELYGVLLDLDFRFIDQDGGLDNYDEEIAIADAIFHGLEGDNQIAIANIVIDRMEPQGVWTTTPDNDPNFGGTDSFYRHYLVDFEFFVAGQNLILIVQGPVLFYATDAGSEGASDYRILGIVDATYGNKATENHTWSGVRALFD